MRLLLLTDIHGRVSRVKRLADKIADVGFDAVVIAGDITYFESLDKAMRILSLIKDLFNTTVYFVAGNCDPIELLTVAGSSTIKNIHRRVEYIGGEYLIYGIAGSNVTPFNTNIEWSEEELKEMISEAGKIDAGKLLIVTHVPPYGILDKVDGINVGSKSLREFLDKHGALLWVTGHIHESRGVERYGETTIVNPGPLMWGYYAIAEINYGEVDVSLEKL